MRHLTAVDAVVVLSDKVVGHALGLHSGEEGDEEDNEDGGDDEDETGIPDSLVEITVLPDDVGGLGGLSNLGLLLLRDVVFVNIFKIKFDTVTLGKDVVSSLRLNRDEGTLGNDKFGLTLEVVVDLLGELLVDFVKLVPLLELDAVTTLAEPVEEPRVVVGKVDVGDDTRLATLLQDDIFQCLCEVCFKPQTVTLVGEEVLLLDLALQLLDDVVVELDLKGVIGCGDRLKIPLTLLNADGALTVLDDGQEDQGSKDIHARGKQSLLTLQSKFDVRDDAAVLDEQGIGLGEDALGGAGLGTERDLVVDAVKEAGLLALTRLQLVSVDWVIEAGEAVALEASRHAGSVSRAN